MRSLRISKLEDFIGYEYDRYKAQGFANSSIKKIKADQVYDIPGCQTIGYVPTLGSQALSPGLPIFVSERSDKIIYMTLTNVKPL